MVLVKGDNAVKLDDPVVIRAYIQSGYAEQKEDKPVTAKKKTATK